MKKVVLGAIISVTSVANVAFAAKNINFLCKPSGGPNGLEIQSLALEVSTEDPEALMTVIYSDEKSVSHMAYEGTSSEYHFTPERNGEGTLSVFLKKGASTWTATVKDAYMDTFSSLVCNKK